MKPAFNRGSIRRSVGFHGCSRQLENDNIRFQELSNHDMFPARTKYHSPTSSLSCENRSTRVLYKLFVSGIHFDTTEESLRYIFSNYGNPMTVSMFRRRNQQLVAHVEYQSKYEADNAIIGLDGKPPLNWDVTYSSACLSDEVSHGHLQDDCVASPTMESERQAFMLPISDLGLQPSYSRQYPHFVQMRRKDSSFAIINPKRNDLVSIRPEFPECVVCGIETSFVCIVCKTRYCSSRCQSTDWPSHQAVCKPLPALVPMSDTVSINKLDLKSSQDCSNIPFHGLHNRSSPVAIQQRRAALEEFSSQHQNNGTAEQLSPNSYFIKGIHPLNQNKESNLVQQVSVTIRRNLENGPITKASAVEVRSVQADSHSPNPMQSKGSSLRSPEWKTSLSQGKSQRADTSSPIRNETSLQNTQKSIARQREVQWRLPTVCKPRNFPLASYCPKTPDSSPPRGTSQTQSTEAPKVYAKKYSSVPLKQPEPKCNLVWVCSAKSPYEFFVQYFCYKEMLQEVMKNVEISFPYSDPLINPVEGLPCVAIFPEDRNWYRAQIVKILPDGITVRYVDYGNCISMPNTPEHLRMMEHHISESPFYAVKVKLVNVLPLNGSKWDDDVRLKFKELVENRPFMMEFVQMDADIMCVRLKYQDKSDLLTCLLKENLARKVTLEVSDELERIPSIVEIPTESSAEPLSVQNPPISSFPLPTENVAINSSHILKLSPRLHAFVSKDLVENTAPSSKVISKMVSSMTKFVSTKNEVAPEITNDLPVQSQNNVSEIPACPMVETESSYKPAPVNKDKGSSFDSTPDQFFYHDGPFMDLPKNESFQALIIKVENPKLIYLRVTSEEISKKLDKLKEDLEAYANDVGGSHCPEEKEVCIACFPDGQWYRAFCAYLEGTRYVCQQVDYGGKHAIKSNDIRRITKRLVDFLPYLVHHAILEGTESMEECEPKLVNRLQKILCENTVVDVVVVSRLELSYIIHIPEVSRTLSFENLI